MLKEQRPCNIEVHAHSYEGYQLGAHGEFRTRWWLLLGTVAQFDIVPVPGDGEKRQDKRQRVESQRHRKWQREQKYVSE